MGRRPYYAEYVNHCLRFYCRNTAKPRFKSDVDSLNWHACESVLKDCTDEERQILVEVYSQNDTLADNICQTAKAHRIHQDKVWNLINEVSRKIAKQRTLL